MAANEERAIWRTPLSTPIRGDENGTLDLFKHLEKLLASAVSICRLKGSVECQTGGLITVCEEMHRLIRVAFSENIKLEKEIKRQRNNFEETISFLKDRVTTLEEEKESVKQTIHGLMKRMSALERSSSAHEQLLAGSEVIVDDSEMTESIEYSDPNLFAASLSLERNKEKCQENQDENSESMPPDYLPSGDKENSRAGNKRRRNSKKTKLDSQSQDEASHEDLGTGNDFHISKNPNEKKQRKSSRKRSDEKDVLLPTDKEVPEVDSVVSKSGKKSKKAPGSTKGSKKPVNHKNAAVVGVIDVLINKDEEQDGHDKEADDEDVLASSVGTEKILIEEEGNDGDVLGNEKEAISKVSKKKTRGKVAGKRKGIDVTDEEEVIDDLDTDSKKPEPAKTKNSDTGKGKTRSLKTIAHKNLTLQELVVEEDNASESDAFETKKKSSARKQKQSKKSKEEEPPDSAEVGDGSNEVFDIVRLIAEDSAIEAPSSSSSATPKHDPSSKSKSPSSYSKKSKPEISEKEENLGDMTFLIDISSRLTTFVTDAIEEELELPLMTARERSDRDKGGQQIDFEGEEVTRDQDATTWED